MCEWGNWELVKVLVPADLSCTGKAHWKLAKIDKCIASIVQALNEAGIYTRGCCCGHNKKDGYIELQDGRILVIKQDAIEYLARR